MTENEDLISRSTLVDSFRKCYSGHMGMENSDNLMMIKSIYRIINDQEAIGTIEEFKALKEKNTAKKIRYEHYCGFRDAECPVCEKGIDNKDEYCSRCGQKLDRQ